MKIKLKTLGLPYTKGYFIDMSDRTASSTGFKDINSALALSEIFFQDSTGIIAGERLGTQHTVWIPFSLFGDLIEPIRGTRLALSLKLKDLNTAIKSITWQSGNTIRILLPDNINISQALVNDYMEIITATNSVNNGIFQISGLGKSGSDYYIDITNNNRSDNTKDETVAVTALVKKAYRTFEISDIKNEIQSIFEEHYEINIYHRND